MAERILGTVSHYYGKLGVAGVELSGEHKVGNTIDILGHTSNSAQTIESIHVEQEAVDSAEAGDPIWIEVKERACVHDPVLVVTPLGP